MKMKLVLLFAVAFAKFGEHLLEAEHYALFDQYVVEFDKTYTTDAEKQARFKIFSDNLVLIAEHNAANHTYKFGMGPFTDMTADEFKQEVGGCFTPKENHGENAVLLDESTMADSIDWATKQCGSGACVTPIKNQKSCGSCWAFSSTGEIESRTAIATGQLVSLSEQQLVDCSKREGNEGCNGGLMDNAFKYVIKEGGLCTEEAYPYKAKNDITCKANRDGCKKNDPIKSFHDVQADSETQLQAAVTAGPVSVAIEADKAIFQHYKSGVITGMCGQKLDHGVLAVGYGTSNDGVDFWKVKNSWGPTWGDRGYVLLKRGKAGGGECGIAKQPSYVVV